MVLRCGESAALRFKHPGQRQACTPCAPSHATAAQPHLWSGVRQPLQCRPRKPGCAIQAERLRVVIDAIMIVSA